MGVDAYCPQSLQCECWTSVLQKNESHLLQEMIWIHSSSFTLFFSPRSWELQNMVTALVVLFSDDSRFCTTFIHESVAGPLSYNTLSTELLPSWNWNFVCVVLNWKRWLHIVKLVREPARNMIIWINIPAVNAPSTHYHVLAIWSLETWTTFCTCPKQVLKWRLVPRVCVRMIS